MMNGDFTYASCRSPTDEEACQGRPNHQLLVTKVLLSRTPVGGRQWQLLPCDKPRIIAPFKWDDAQPLKCGM